MEEVTLPLSGIGDATTDVAVETRPDGAVLQLVKTTLADPQSDILVATALAPGANVDINADDITTGKVGQLIGVDVGSSVPCRVDVQSVNGPRVTHTSLYSHGSWRSPAASLFELAGGAGKHFGISVTNLSGYQTADVRVTIYWDEVNP